MLAEALRRVSDGLTLRDSHGLAQLPISLTIKLIRSDKYGAILLSSVEKEAVGWEAFILVNFDYVSDFQSCRSLYRPGSVTIQAFVLLIIQRLVLSEALDIVNGLLHQRNHQHEGQRRNVSEQVADFESRYELRQGDD